MIMAKKNKADKLHKDVKGRKGIPGHYGKAYTKLSGPDEFRKGNIAKGSQVSRRVKPQPPAPWRGVPE